MIASDPINKIQLNDRRYSATSALLGLVWFCCHPAVFSRLFAIQEHVVIHLNCFLPDSRVNCGQHFSAVRVLRIWNSLPEDVVSADHFVVVH